MLFKFDFCFLNLREMALCLKIIFYFLEICVPVVDQPLTSEVQVENRLG